MSFKRGYDPNRTWEVWVAQRSRQIGFIVALLILLIILIIFGPTKPG